MSTLNPLWAMFAIGCVFGAAARWGRFCFLRGLLQQMSVKDRENGGAPALQAFALAMAVALVCTQWMVWNDQVDIAQAAVVRNQFSVVAVLTGGALMGIGMVMARSCGSRSLVLLGGGNLRALLSLLCLALAAQATLTGVLAPARQWLQSMGSISLPYASLPEHLLASGWPTTLAVLVAIALPATLLLLYAMWQPALRQSPPQWLAAITIGMTISAGWWVTSHVGIDEFNPLPPFSLSFVGPLAESLLYLQVAVGRDLHLGVAMVAGTFAGACVVALTTRTAHWEGFQHPSRMLATAVGSSLFGFGGVLAVGCTIGQGLSGFSTLAYASLPALIGIVIGSAGALQFASLMFNHQEDPQP